MARDLVPDRRNSRTVAISDDFLTSYLSLSPEMNHIDFASSVLPENAECLALTIDNILSEEECEQLIHLAETNATELEEGGAPWKPAKIIIGQGTQAAVPEYRNCGRIEWDQQSVVDRIWDRCARVPGFRELFAVVIPEGSFNGQKWEFRRFNEHMRFLRYEPGQFFKSHFDNPIWYEYKRSEFQSHYTVMVYLSDNKTDRDGTGSLKRGVTSFLSRDRKRRVNVNPKSGSILIFQQRGLLHEGTMVERGVKYALRLDMMYEWVDGETDGNKRAKV